MRRNVEELHKRSTAEEQTYLATVHSLQERIIVLQGKCEERDARRKAIEERSLAIQSLEMRATEGEIIRRRLHNTLQELRGNLRVIARVRPVLPNVRKKSSEPAVWTDGDESVCVRYKERVRRGEKLRPVGAGRIQRVSVHIRPDGVGKDVYHARRRRGGESRHRSPEHREDHGGHRASA